MKYIKNPTSKIKSRKTFPTRIALTNNDQAISPVIAKTEDFLWHLVSFNYRFVNNLMKKKGQNSKQNYIVSLILFQDNSQTTWLSRKRKLEEKSSNHYLSIYFLVFR